MDSTVLDMVTMLSCADQANAQRILLALTGSVESCQALRRAGCMPLLIQILHPINVPVEAHPSAETKTRAVQMLKNVVQFNCDEKMKRKELRVLKLLESMRLYIDSVKARGSVNWEGSAGASGTEKHPVPSSTALMKLSFDEEHRSAMCLLGAIHTLADLIQTEHAIHGISGNADCLTLRRYSGMTLTNLTVGDKRNKILLGSMKDFMMALVAQLDSPNEDVCQVTASVLRNLSWHASSALRASLVDSNAVKKLMVTAMNATKESTLKAALSALWNLSAHSNANKIAICQTPNAIEFLVTLLESTAMTTVESAGGILTNISIATKSDGKTRDTFRSCGILEILLNHLQSPSILVVGNACGMLWHLSNCEENQEKLMQLGAVTKLKVLTGSKHERIRHGACSTLRNVLRNCAKLNKSDVSSSTSPESPQTKTLEDNQQPIDLRKTVVPSNSFKVLKPTDLRFTNEPLDLSLHSSKSTPIHTVSELEFGPRQTTSVTFLNPPLHNKTLCSYGSPRSFSSCPEIIRYIQTAHESSPVDFSRADSNVVTVGGDIIDSTINYSLHFTEPSDSNAIGRSEDTVKTYFCEGTPLNFSTSNSMTDLTQVDKQPKLKPIIESETSEDYLRKYCEESTPATFSRASSLSSIASNLQGGENKAEYVEELQPKLNALGLKEKGRRTVTFSATETPLMFSRTSSVNSLESVEVNYEDTGSLVSDFSRRASEVVSPSELPDSPRQIGLSEEVVFKESARTQLPSEQKLSEDMDTLKVFAKGESCGISTAPSIRSLSPLTIDDDTEAKIGIVEPAKLATSIEIHTKVPRETTSDEMRIYGTEGTPWRGISIASSLSDLVSEMEKAELDAVTKESPPEALVQPPYSSSPPPPLPPKPNPLKSKSVDEPLYTDPGKPPSPSFTSMKIEESETKDSKLPKSKSEMSKLNTKAIKMSTSYQENLKRENQLDPELAALILKGKSRVRAGKSSKSSVKQKSISSESYEIDKSTTTSLAQSDVLRIDTIDHSPDSTEKCVADSACKKLSPGREPTNLCAKIQQSTISTTSDWNDDTISSLSIPSLSISTAFKLCQSESNSNEAKVVPDSKPEISVRMIETLTGSLLLQSTLSSVEPPTEFSSNLPSSTGCRRSKFTSNDQSNIMNQKPPPEFDLDNSIMSIASLRTEIASLAPLEDGMKDLSIGDGETYTIGGGGSDCTDAEESFFDETDSIGEVKIDDLPLNENEVEQCPEQKPNIVTPASLIDDRFRTYTTKKHSSPRQKRKDDPTRYLTRTISPSLSPTTPPKDPNGNHTPSPSSNNFSTFIKPERTARIVKPTASVTSDDSSPSNSPKGIRGRRKPLYSSLPSQQKKLGPPIPPKPKPISGNCGSFHVRPTRASELRAASSRDSSPKRGKNSSKNSSTSSLNNSSIPLSSGGGSSVTNRKTPPKPPVRTTPTKNYAGVRPVRTSSSSIGFNGESNIDGSDRGSIGIDSGFSTLPRSLKNFEESKKDGSRIGKLSHLWNQLTKPINKSTSLDLPNGGLGKTERKSKFSFKFGRKKKNCGSEPAIESPIQPSWTNPISAEDVPTSKSTERFNGHSGSKFQRKAPTPPLSPEDVLFGSCTNKTNGSTTAPSKTTPV